MDDGERSYLKVFEKSMPMMQNFGIKRGAVIADAGKIVVLRANALGDFIFSLPALEALRQTYPQAEIVLLAKDWHYQWLRGRPSPVDRVVVLPSYMGVSADPGTEEDTAEIEQFFQRMKQEQYDIAVQLQGGGRYSNPFIRGLHAGMTVGLKAPEAMALDLWVPFVYFQSEIMRYLEVVALVGAKPVTVEPHIMVTGEDLEESYRVVPEGTQPLVVLHPGATDERRRWSAQKFAQVGDTLVQQGVQVVITGVAAETEVVSTVVNAMQMEVQNICGKLTLNGLTGLLSRCQFVIANDTGPLHLAYAVNTPTVGLYWAYNSLTAGEQMRTIHRPIISWRMCCPVCGKDNSWGRCEHQVSFIDDIDIEEVITTALDLLRNCRQKK